MVLTVTYGELHPGSCWVPICLCNFNAHSVQIPTKTVVVQVVPANQVPLVILPTGTSEESTSNPPKGWFLEAMDLQLPREWPKLDKEQARELMLKWEHLLPTVTWTWVELP